MNYSEIIAAAQAYADRKDVEVQDNLDLFIVMVESRINRLLKTREQSYRAYLSGVVDQEYYSLPPDYAGMRDIQVNSAVPTGEHKSYPMDYVSPAQMNVQRNKPFGGRYYYTIIADQIQVFPTLSIECTIEIVYFQRVPNLNSANSINWLSDSHPDAYVAGMTAEIEIFAKNYDAGDSWYTRVTSIISELDNSDEEERWSGSPLQTRLG